MKKFLPLILLVCLFFYDNVLAGSLFNHIDAIRSYSSRAPATPRANTLAKWYRTARPNRTTDKFKCYYHNGLALGFGAVFIAPYNPLRDDIVIALSPALITVVTNHDKKADDTAQVAPAGVSTRFQSGEMYLSYYTGRYLSTVPYHPDASHYTTFNNTWQVIPRFGLTWTSLKSD